ncbi:serine hydrolase [Flavobacterium sp. XS2P12]|uniref:serine hydrolase n=1 Tax=Flavobacterium melibiosi TaxID=3398734 RepID=UPI003A842538
MKILSKFFFLFLCFLLIGCSGAKKNILQETLVSKKESIKRVMDNPEEFELQIIYTQIIRNQNNEVKFKDYAYNLNAKNYFYPASTIKFPIAVLALEKLNTIQNTSINSEFLIEGKSNKIKFSEEILKIFAVSDNDASNNLLEFIGFDYLNKSMHSKGLKRFRISHRLSTPDSGNPVTKSLTLYKTDNSILTLPSIFSKYNKPLGFNKIKKGIGYMDDDKLVQIPFDFSNKNYYPLETLHNTLKRIVFPEVFKKRERFNLTEKNREFILFSMQNLPKNAGYDPIKYYDGYCKFFMFGDTKESIPEHIKIYNKVGDAYGTLIDCAYIVDTKNQIEFMISATILVNKDQVFNDNIYEYDEVGLPFLAELGRQLYDKNLKKKSN